MRTNNPTSQCLWWMPRVISYFWFSLPCRQVKLISGQDQSSVRWQHDKWQNPAIAEQEHTHWKDEPGKMRDRSRSSSIQCTNRMWRHQKPARVFRWPLSLMNVSIKKLTNKNPLHLRKPKERLLMHSFIQHLSSWAHRADWQIWALFRPGALHVKGVRHC